MRKVINGKSYDTDTAEVVCSFRYGGSLTNRSYIEATLYRTPRGSFFSTEHGSDNIRIRHYGEAREIAERNADTATVERLFYVEEG